MSVRILETQTITEERGRLNNRKKPRDVKHVYEAQTHNFSLLEVRKSDDRSSIDMMISVRVQALKT